MNMLARRMNFVDDMDGSANAKLLARFENAYGPREAGL